MMWISGGGFTWCGRLATWWRNNHGKWSLFILCNCRRVLTWAGWLTQIEVKKDRFYLSRYRYKSYIVDIVGKERVRS
jgi:hypothetical protein